MKILYRHILRAHLGPFAFTFLTVVFVFTLQFVTRVLDRFVGKGLETSVILELILLQTAWMAVLAAPMAVLVSTLMAFGDLSNSLELAAIRAGGISLWRLMLPVVLASVLLVFLVERFNNVVLPEANHRAKILLTDISRKKPNFGLKPGVFSNMIYGYSMLARRTEEESPVIGGVTIYDYSQPQRNTVITADSGAMEFTADYRTLIINLYDGEMHEMDLQTRKTYRKVVFTHHRVSLPATDFGFERTDESQSSRGDRELSATAMLEICDTYRTSSARARATLGQQTRTAFLALLSVPDLSGSLPHPVSGSFSHSVPDSFRRPVSGSLPRPHTPALPHPAAPGVPHPPVQADTSDLTVRLLDAVNRLTAGTPAASPNTSLASLTVSADTLSLLTALKPEQQFAAAEQALSLARASLSQTEMCISTVSNDDGQIGRYMVEVHKKYSIPAACFFFVLVGVPLGVLAKRGGFGVGAGLSLAFFIVYWGFLIGGEKLADRGLVSPAVAMWIANIFIFLIGVILLLRVSGFSLLPRRRRHPEVRL